MFELHSRCDCCYNWINKTCKMNMTPCNMGNFCKGWVTDAYRKYKDKDVCWNCSHGEMDKGGLYCHLNKSGMKVDNTCEHFKFQESLKVSYKKIQELYPW